MVYGWNVWYCTHEQQENLSGIVQNKVKVLKANECIEIMQYNPKRKGNKITKRNLSCHTLQFP